MAVIPPSVYEDVGVYEKSQLDEMAEEIDLPKERISTVVRVGGVYPELLAEAEDWKADLIVVGAHRRSMATAEPARALATAFISLATATTSRWSV